MKTEEFLDFNYFNLIDDFEFIQSVYDYFQQIGPKTKNQDQIIKTGYAQNLFKGLTKVGLNYLDGVFSLPIRLEIYNRNEDLSLKIKKNPYYQKLIEFDKIMIIESYDVYCERKKKQTYCYPKIRMQPKTKSQTKALKGYCTTGFRGVAKVGLKYLLNTYQMPANIEGDSISYQELRKKLTYEEIHEKYFKTKPTKVLIATF